MNRAVTLGLSLVLFLLLVANSAAFFFAQPYYEYWDLAANSLAVDQAKHFHAMYGCYSRWGFHHPGPVLFYVQALGEWLFYDVLHWAAAPYNGQVLAHLALMTFFFSASLTVFLRWLPARSRWAFLCAALALGALHFAASARIPSFDVLRGTSAFLSTWTAHALVLPLFCLLAAGASVAAGRGADLPLVAFAGGVLVHTHVAQPLFVVPLTLLAGIGLLAAHGWRPGAVWRAHRGSLVFAGGIIALFALPLVLDLFRGTDSNFAAILRHMRLHHDERKSWLHSLLYFLQFGAYSPYETGQMDFHHYDRAGIFAYLRAHAALFAGWLAVVTIVLAAFVRQARAGFGGHAPIDPAPAPSLDRGPFLAWAGIFLLAVIGLTLYWGTIQDGLMFYYNAWGNFGIYYFALLIALAELCGGIGSRWRPARRHSAIALGWLLPTVIALLAFFAAAPAYRISDPIRPADLALHDGIARAIKAADSTGLKLLNFPTEAWPVAVTVALQLERAGQPVGVPEPWAVTFSEEHGWGSLPESEARTGRNWRFIMEEPHGIWSSAADALARFQQNLLHAVAVSRAEGQAASGPFPLLNGVRLDVALRTLDFSAADGTAVIGCTPGGNLTDYILGGWSFPEPNGTWTDGKLAILRFHASTAGPGGVDLSLHVGPFLPPKGPTAQRLKVLFDGEPLAPEQRITGPETVKLTVPAALWRRSADAAGAVLEFELPDATSPAAADPTGRTIDGRALGLYCQQIRFQEVR
jgi:hypothetical protein